MAFPLRIMTEPQQGDSYDDQLALAQEAEALGFDAYFRSDHYLRMGGDPAGPEALPGPTDAWLTLAGLARETSRIRLGTLWQTPVGERFSYGGRHYRLAESPALAQTTPAAVPAHHRRRFRFVPCHRPLVVHARSGVEVVAGPGRSPRRARAAPGATPARRPGTRPPGPSPS